MSAISPRIARLLKLTVNAVSYLLVASTDTLWSHCRVLRVVIQALVVAHMNDDGNKDVYSTTIYRYIVHYIYCTGTVAVWATWGHTKKGGG